MLGTCECGKVIGATADKCPGCGGVNLYYAARARERTKRALCDVCWGLLLAATIIYFLMFFSMLGHAENIMQ